MRPPFSPITRRTYNAKKAQQVPVRSEESEESEDDNKEASKDSISEGIEACIKENAPSRDLLTTALAGVSNEEIETLLGEVVERPESSLRKEKWVVSLFNKFCERTKHEITFSDVKFVCGFVKFLAIYARYAVSGIQQIIIPALRHVATDAGDCDDQELKRQLAFTITQLRHNPNVRQAGTGKPPLCYFDVAE